MGVCITGTSGSETRDGSYSYGTFSRIRDTIAKAMGIEDWRAHYRDKITPYTLMGFWVYPSAGTDETVPTPDDDIDYLMLHQDDEGIFMPWTSQRIATRLKDLLARSVEWDSSGVRRVAIELLDLFEWAGENGVILEVC